jgi:hypothetical protein
MEEEVRAEVKRERSIIIAASLSHQDLLDGETGQWSRQRI